MRKPASFYFFKRKPIVLKDRYECWRGVADLLVSTTQERLRVEMYKTKSSRPAAGFLYRLRYLDGQTIEKSQTDNGSEFAWEFERATAKLGIQRYFSRVKTTKDNLDIEIQPDSGV